MDAKKTGTRLLCTVALLFAMFACVGVVDRIHGGEYGHAVGDAAFAFLFTLMAAAWWPLP